MTDEQGGIPSTDAAASGAPTPAPAPKRSRRRTWTAVGIVAAVIVGVGGVLIVVNPWGASMTFVLVLGAAFIANGAVDLFIEWYARDSAKQADLMARPR